MMQMAAYGRLGQGSSGASGIDGKPSPLVDPVGPQWKWRARRDSNSRPPGSKFD